MQNTVANSLSLQSVYYETLNNKDVFKITLQNSSVSVGITNIGCSIISIETPDRSHRYKNIVAGFSVLEEYATNKEYFGCIVGRYANRIASGIFSLDGKKHHLSINERNNHLHGGFEGFNKKIWDIAGFIEEPEQVGVVFTYHSKDGEEGYPGNLQVTVSYCLNTKNQLCIGYKAQTDKATPVNLTNHTYFNLTGFDVPEIKDHLLQVHASGYTEKNRQNLPTGSILPVENTALDLRTARKIGVNIGTFPFDMGYDHNFVLDNFSENKVNLAACLYEPLYGRVVNIYTSQPGLQVYTANFWDGSILGSQGLYYKKHGAVALETQAFPDSPNHPAFPGTILNPHEQYLSTTVYEFSEK